MITIIAEAGVNHCGSKERALEMVHAAAKAGADYVKFQTFKAEKLVSKSAPKAEYQAANDPTSGQTQLEMLKALELTINDFKDIADECNRCGIGFLSTPFDLDSIRELEALNMDFWKIPSGEITNLPYLRTIARQGKPVVMSTGMSSLPEINAAVQALCDAGLQRDQITLLHCNTQYPTPPVDVNLRAMESLRELGCNGVGFSDHTLGIAIPLAAAALGAEVIEKHFTLSRELPGPDHKASLTPTELAEMVNGIRTIEQALGRKEKVMTDSEKTNVSIARKSIVASREIRKGEIFSDENLTTKRPATGLSPMQWDSVIGTPARRDYLPDEPIDKI
ncbi:MAG: N-acetylneuraminate synthase [Muribaculaceae bacterium]|nr:N-acetylneuraminate synthase [Muribaculaceae bacterium]